MLKYIVCAHLKGALPLELMIHKKLVIIIINGHVKRHTNSSSIVSAMKAVDLHQSIDMHCQVFTDPDE